MGQDYFSGISELCPGKLIESGLAVGREVVGVEPGGVGRCIVECGVRAYRDCNGLKPVFDVVGR